MDDLSLVTLLWLFGIALVAGTIDAMAGGGGLLCLPGLLAAGLDPLAASATNKLQSVFGSFSATLHFWREGRLRLREHVVPAAASFFGALLGAASLAALDPQFLRQLIPLLLIAVALWVLLSPGLGQVKRQARLSYRRLGLTVVPLIGCYDGFLGPGTGTFFALSSVALLGLTLDEATVRAKLYNVMSNLGALTFFLFGGHIVWLAGAVMALGQLIGGNLGARLILRHGTSVIKPLLVVMSLAMSAKLLLW